MKTTLSTLFILGVCLTSFSQLTLQKKGDQYSASLASGKAITATHDTIVEIKRYNKQSLFAGIDGVRYFETLKSEADISLRIRSVFEKASRKGKSYADDAYTYAKLGTIVDPSNEVYKEFVSGKEETHKLTSSFQTTSIYPEYRIRASKISIYDAEGKSLVAMDSSILKFGGSTDGISSNKYFSQLWDSYYLKQFEEGTTNYYNLMDEVLLSYSCLMIEQMIANSKVPFYKAKVGKDTHILDKEGKLVSVLKKSSAWYDYVHPIGKENVFLIPMKNKKKNITLWNMYDMNNNLIVEGVTDYHGNEQLIIEANGKEALYNEEVKKIIDWSDDIKSLDDGYAVTNGGVISILDKEGKTISTGYSTVKSPYGKGDCYIVQKEKQWYIIDKQAKELGGPYTEVESFYKNTFYIKEGGPFIELRSYWNGNWTTNIDSILYSNEFNWLLAVKRPSGWELWRDEVTPLYREGWYSVWPVDDEYGDPSPYMVQKTKGGKYAVLFGDPWSEVERAKDTIGHVWMTDFIYEGYASMEFEDYMYSFLIKKDDKYAIFPIRMQEDSVGYDPNYGGPIWKREMRPSTDFIYDDAWYDYDMYEITGEYDFITESNGKQGIYNADYDTEVLPNKYDDIDYMYDYEFLITTADGKKGIIKDIRQTGERGNYKFSYFEVEPQYDELIVKEDWIVMRNDKLYGYRMAYDGMEVILDCILKEEPTYDFMYEEYETFPEAIVNGKSVFVCMNDSGYTTYESYEFNGNFEVYIVSNNGKYGMLDYDRRGMLEVKYDAFEFIDETDMMTVKLNGKYGINYLSDVVCEPIYDELMTGSYTGDEIFGAKKDGKWGVYVGKDEFLPHEYDDLKITWESVEALKDGKWETFNF